MNPSSVLSSIPNDLDAFCLSCAAPLFLSVSELGSSLRCTACHSRVSEVVVEPTLRLPFLLHKWDVYSGKLDMLPVTLPCDRPAPISSNSSVTTEEGEEEEEGTASEADDSESKTSLAAHHFADAELVADPLASSFFVTSFDAYEVSSCAVEYLGAATLPVDVLDMQEQLFLDMPKEVATGEEAEEETVEQQKEKMESREEADEAATQIHESKAVEGGEEKAQVKQQVTAGEDEDEDHIATPRLKPLDRSILKEDGKLARQNLHRHLSAFLRASAVPAAGRREQTTSVQSTLSSSLSSGMPVSTVKEETLSDMEGASDVSRAASSATKGSRAPSTSEKAAAATSPDVPPAIPENPNSLPDSSIAPSDAPVVVDESKFQDELSGFIGLDSLDPLPSLSQGTTSGTGAHADASAAAAAGEGSGMDLGTQALFPGLQTAASTFIETAQLALDTEAPASTLSRSFSLTCNMLAADLSGIGSSPANTSSSAAASVSTAAAGMGLHRGMSSFGLDPSMSFMGGFGDMGFSRQGSSVFPSTSASFAGSSAAMSSQPLTSQPSFSGMPLLSTPSMFGAPSSMVPPAATQQLLSRTNSFARVANSKVSGVLTRGIMSQASFAIAYNQEVQHQMQQQQQQQQQLLSRTHSTQPTQELDFFEQEGWGGVGEVGNFALHSHSQPDHGAMDFSGIAPTRGFCGAGAELPLSQGGGHGGEFEVPAPPLPSMSRQLSLTHEGGVVPPPLPSPPTVAGGSQDSLGLGELEPPRVGSDLLPPQRLSSIGFGLSVGGGNGAVEHKFDMPPPPPVHVRPQTPPVSMRHLEPRLLDAETVAKLSQAALMRTPSPVGTRSRTPRGTQKATPTPTALSQVEPPPPDAAAIARCMELLSVSSALRLCLQDYCEWLKTPLDIAELAGHIAREMQVRKLSDTRQSPSICAAALYLAYVLQGKKPTQNAFCSKIGVTEVTLRKVYKGDLVPNWYHLVPDDYEPKVVPADFPARPARPAVPRSKKGGAAQKESPLPTRSVSSTMHALHADAKNQRSASILMRPPPSSAASAGGNQAFLQRAPSLMRHPSFLMQRNPSSRLIPFTFSNFPPRSLPPGYLSLLFPTSRPGTSLRIEMALPLNTQGTQLVQTTVKQRLGQGGEKKALQTQQQAEESKQGEATVGVAEAGSQSDTDEEMPASQDTVKLTQPEPSSSNRPPSKRSKSQASPLPDVPKFAPPSQEHLITSQEQFSQWIKAPLLWATASTPRS